MLRSTLCPVYFPNTIAKGSNSTVKSNTLLVKYIYTPNGGCVRACFASAQFFFSRRGGGCTMSMSTGPWVVHQAKRLLVFVRVRGMWIPTFFCRDGAGALTCPGPGASGFLIRP